MYYSYYYILGFKYTSRFTYMQLPTYLLVSMPFLIGLLRLAIHTTGMAEGVKIWGASSNVWAMGYNIICLSWLRLD